MDKLKLETPNMTEKNIEQIANLFPNVITEAKDENREIKKVVDFEKLKQELSDFVIEGEESYDFTWVGKRESILEANKPIRKTLRPDRESSVEWENTENIYIEGDNLEALKLLQESYLGKVKMIYIDPPYNTGKDFVYRDNFTLDKDSYEEELGLRDENNNKLFQNTETNGRFHSDWCSMIYPRLKLARNLLCDDGVIFISIDDNEVRNLKNICDEVFGEDNFIAQLVRQEKAGAGHDSKGLAIEFDYIIMYAKNNTCINLNKEKVNTDEDPKYKLEDSHVKERGKYYLRDLDYRGSYSESLDYPITLPDGKVIYSGGKLGRPNTWRWSKQKVEWGIKNDFIVFKGEKVYIKQYQYVDNNGEPRDRYIPYRALVKFLNSEGTTQLSNLNLSSVFSFPKSVNLINYLLNISTNDSSIILDFFSGSATTAHAVMQLNSEDNGNRKFIMVQMPELTDEKSEAYKAGYKNICEIGKERIRRAGKKIQEENPDKKIDIGFRVFKVDDTNMNDVYYAPKDYNKSLLDNLTSNIKDGRTDEDLLYGCLLDWGVELSLPHKVEIIDGKKVHIVNDTDLIACFEQNISELVVREIAKKQPTRVVFRDSSFNTDDHKINVEEIFKMLAPNTTVKVI